MPHQGAKNSTKSPSGFEATASSKVNSSKRKSGLNGRGASGASVSQTMSLSSSLLSSALEGDTNERMTARTKKIFLKRGGVVDKNADKKPVLFSNILNLKKAIRGENKNLAGAESKNLPPCHKCLRAEEQVLCTSAVKLTL